MGTQSLKLDQFSIKYRSRLDEALNIGVNLQGEIFNFKIKKRCVRRLLNNLSAVFAEVLKKTRVNTFIQIRIVIDLMLTH